MYNAIGLWLTECVLRTDEGRGYFQCLRDGAKSQTALTNTGIYSDI
jgi:hypothetical protein